MKATSLPSLPQLTVTMRTLWTARVTQNQKYVFLLILDSNSDTKVEFKIRNPIYYFYESVYEMLMVSLGLQGTPTTGVSTETGGFL